MSLSGSPLGVDVLDMTESFVYVAIGARLGPDRMAGQGVTNRILYPAKERPIQPSMFNR